MHTLWVILTLILVIGSFLGLIFSFFKCQQHFMRTCIGFGVLWIGYGIMLYLLTLGSTFVMV